MMKILALLCLLGLVRGQPQYPCCSVPAWEAIEGFMIGTSTSGQGAETEGGAKLSFDGDKKMINSYIESITSGVATKLRVLEDFNQKIRYTIDAQQTCTKTTVTEAWRPSCVPAGSEKVSSQYFGSETSPLEVNSYRIPEIMGLRGYISVTNDGCIPVAEALYGTIGSTSEVLNLHFTNFTAGIKDPSVFVVPPECQSARFTPMAHSPAKRFRRSVLY